MSVRSDKLYSAMIVVIVIGMNLLLDFGFGLSGFWERIPFVLVAAIVAAYLWWRFVDEPS